jgi:hypothetical protein
MSNRTKINTLDAAGYSDLLRAIEYRPDVSTDERFRAHIAAIRSIRIEHPRLLGIHRDINILRQDVKDFRGQEQFVLPIIGPSQAGKSTAIDHYIDKHVAPVTRPGLIPVLRVNMSPRSSLKQLQADILRPLVVDEHGSTDEGELRVGTEAEFRQRVRRYAELRQTEVIVIDESQHLLRANAMERAKQVADSIKLMAIEGAASFVVIGTGEAWSIFSSNADQTALRCKEPIFLKALDWSLGHEADLFTGYVAFLDAKLVEHGLTAGLSGFVEDDMPECFWEVSRGILGRVSRLTRIAWETAFALNQTTISRALLAAAVDRWAIPLGLCRHNPFREGARDYELVMQDWKQNPIMEDL